MSHPFGAPFARCLRSQGALCDPGLLGYTPSVWEENRSPSPDSTSPALLPSYAAATALPARTKIETIVPTSMIEASGTQYFRHVVMT